MIASGTFPTLLLELMMAVHKFKQTLRLERRYLILTRSAYDYKRVRQPAGVGDSQISTGFAYGPVGLVYTQEYEIKYKEPPSCSD